MSKLQTNEYDLIIDPNQIKKDYYKELFKSRELFYFFTWRDILVRYKQAVLGIIWALIRPLLTMVIFAFVFGKLARLPSDGIPYGVFVLAGMIVWQFFSNTLADSCVCLVNNANLITKIYFPRLILPLSQVVVNIIDFAIAFFLLVALSLFYGVFHVTSLLILPMIGLQLFILSSGCGFWLSAVTVKYRDFRILVTLVIQFGMFLSPIGYGSFIVPEQWQLFYFLNPLTGIIETLRWSMFGVYHAYLPLAWGMSVVSSLTIFGFGLLFFRKMENNFADII